MEFYRYVSSSEMGRIRETRQIGSRSGVTYFSPDRYDDAQEAYRRLALPRPPDFRVGPIPDDEMPDFDVVPLMSVGFVDPNRLGGGTEAATSRPVRLFAAYDFASRTNTTI